MIRRKFNWPKATPRCLPNSDTFVVSGFLNETLGIGRAANLTLAALNSLGLSALAHDLRPLQRHLLRRRAQDFKPSNEAQIWILQANPIEAELALYALNPHHWGKLYRIAYWVWETSLAPPIYGRLADYFHEIWVPSQFVFDAISARFEINKRPDLKTRLKIMPHPVTGCKKEAASKAKRNDTILALTLFDPRSDFDRKNPQASIRAWEIAFPVAIMGYKLVVKTLPEALNYPQYLALKSYYSERRDIVFVEENMAQDKLEETIGLSDVLISLHRSEGFGISLAEAMLAGVCVIATEGTGNGDFMNEKNSVLVPAKKVAATSIYAADGADWLEPDIQEAGILIKQVLNDSSMRSLISNNATRLEQTLFMPWAALLARDN